MKPFRGFRRLIACSPLHYGSGIAAKQYDPGAPFFLEGYGLLAIGYWPLQKHMTLLERSGGSFDYNQANSP
jgi:hypothetical protein